MKKILPILLIIVAFSCSDEVTQPNIYLVDSEQVLSFTAQTIQNNLRLAGSNSLADKAKYEIAVYKVTYNTTYKGEPIVASGLIGLPITSDPQPMISLQHGTIATSAEAPSNSISSYGQLSWFTSFGYIMLFPDFIGYGESDEVLHPYYHEESTANSITDMLLAAKEFAEDNNISFNGEVFLAGYSEGGYATMATHKSLEENPIDGFSLVASAPASGGYDLNGMVNYLFSQDEYFSPFYIAFVALSYKQTYDWTYPLTLYFNEPFASSIPELFNGINRAGAINDRLTINIQYLLSKGFKEGLFTDEAYIHIKDAFEENSLLDWVPENKMIMYHGTEDVTVPFANSQSTFDILKNNGAANIEFLPLPGDHSTSFLPYLSDVIERFDSLK